MLKSSLLASLALSLAVPGVAHVLAPSSAFAAEARFDGQAIATLGDASGLRLGESRVSGTGSFVFADKLDAIGADSSHAITFTVKDGGSLSLVAYADPSLGQGLSFVFTREGNSLKGLLMKGGETASALDFSSELSKIDASGIVRLQIDVHNGESPAHVLVWDGIETSFSEDNALLNTEELGTLSHGNGTGVRRGFVLEDATLLEAVASGVKFDH